MEEYRQALNLDLEGDVLRMEITKHGLLNAGRDSVFKEAEIAFINQVNQHSEDTPNEYPG